MSNKTLARKLRTKDEEKRGINLFETKAWEARKAARANKVANRIAKAQLRKEKIIK